MQRIFAFAVITTLLGIWAATIIKPAPNCEGTYERGYTKGVMETTKRFREAL